MAAIQGTHYQTTFALTDSAGAAVDLTGMEFEADFRTTVESDTELVNLTTGNGGFTIESPATAGRLTMSMTSVQTALLPVGRVVFDVQQSNANPGPDFLFRGTLIVKQSVTR